MVSWAGLFVLSSLALAALCLLLLLLGLGREFSLGGDEPLGELPDIGVLVDVLSLCLLVDA